MNLSLLSGALAFIVGIIYTIQAYLLPNATIGNPMAPKILPIGLGILMILFGVSLITQEVKKSGFKFLDGKKAKIDENLKLILYTCAACILYAILFNRIGYVLSTIVFLEIILLLFNGKEKWKVNTLVSICFSTFIYVVFSKFLGIILPVMPFFYI